MAREELFYFSNSDLMIKVKINDDQNTAKYHTHRATNYSERTFVEHYISTKVLNAGDIYKTLKVTFVDVDSALMEEYKRFEAKGFPGRKTNSNFASDKQKLDSAMSKLKAKDKEITAMVVDLCTNANDAFWFDRLGDILRDRNENHKDEPKYRLRDLIEAIAEYNKTVKKEKRIKIENLI